MRSIKTGRLATHPALLRGEPRPRAPLGVLFAVVVPMLLAAFVPHSLQTGAMLAVQLAAATGIGVLLALPARRAPILTAARPGSR